MHKELIEKVFLVQLLLTSEASGSSWTLLPGSFVGGLISISFSDLVTPLVPVGRIMSFVEEVAPGLEVGFTVPIKVLPVCIFKVVVSINGFVVVVVAVVVLVKSASVITIGMSGLMVLSDFVFTFSVIDLRSSVVGLLVLDVWSISGLSVTSILTSVG